MAAYIDTFLFFFLFFLFLTLSCFLPEKEFAIFFLNFCFFSWFALIAIENKDESKEKWHSLENVIGRFARSILKIRLVVRITFLANFKCWNYDEDVWIVAVDKDITRCDMQWEKRKRTLKRKKSKNKNKTKQIKV